MSTFISLCMVHNPLPIISICIGNNHLTPLCARCLNDHIHSHQSKGEKCHIVDSQRFVEKYDKERVKAIYELQQGIGNMIRLEECSKKYVQTSLVVVEEARRKALSHLSKSFNQLKDRIAKEAEVTCERVLQSIKHHKIVLVETLTKLKSCLGVSGLLMFLEREGYKQIIVNSNSFINSKLFPQYKINESFGEDISTAIEQSLDLQEKSSIFGTSIAKSTWMFETRKSSFDSLQKSEGANPQITRQSFLAQAELRQNKSSFLKQNLNNIRNSSADKPLPSSQRSSARLSFDNSKEVLGMKYVVSQTLLNQGASRPQTPSSNTNSKILGESIKYAGQQLEQKENMFWSKQETAKSIMQIGDHFMFRTQTK